MTGNEYDMELSEVFSALSADVIVPGTVMFIVSSPFDIFCWVSITVLSAAKTGRTIVYVKDKSIYPVK